MKTYVRDARPRWDTAMQRRRRRAVADLRRHPRRDQRRRQAGPVAKGDPRGPEPPLQLSRDWVVDPDTNIDREKRIARRQQGARLARGRRAAVYHRVHALQESLCMAEGEELAIADCADNASSRHGDPLPRELKASCTNGPPWPCPSAGRVHGRATRTAARGWTPTT